MQLSFSEESKEQYIPLAIRLRPQSFDEFIGQSHIIGENKILSNIILQDKIPSIILWGPSGVGKTTLARIIANTTSANFIEFSAVSTSINKIKDYMIRATIEKKKTIIFIDEIHRFNKAQQDVLLPFVEQGKIILIGATTENPSFELNSALLSRCKVFVLYQLTKNEVIKVLNNAIKYYGKVEKKNIIISKEIINEIAKSSNGDARVALNILEIVINNTENINGIISPSNELVEQCIGKRILKYDKNGDEHYDLISALHKSMRNSDVHAAIYWLTRMLESGENPLYIARRIIRFASEDIGMADSNALLLSVSAYQACHFNGMPECTINLTHAVIYCTLAEKSNSIYLAEKKARSDVEKTLNEPVPLVIRNDVTSLTRELGYSKGYKYDYNHEYEMFNLQCLPDNLIENEYYKPTMKGKEKKYIKIISEIKEKRKQNND